MEAAQARYQLGPGSQRQVVGVGQDAFGPAGAEIRRGQALDRRQGPDRHEGRGP